MALIDLCPALAGARRQRRQGRRRKKNRRARTSKEHGRASDSACGPHIQASFTSLHDRRRLEGRTRSQEGGCNPCCANPALGRATIWVAFGSARCACALIEDSAGMVDAGRTGLLGRPAPDRTGATALCISSIRPATQVWPDSSQRRLRAATISCAVAATPRRRLQYSLASRSLTKIKVKRRPPSYGEVRQRGWCGRVTRRPHRGTFRAGLRKPSFPGCRQARGARENSAPNMYGQGIPPRRLFSRSRGPAGNNVCLIFAGLALRSLAEHFLNVRGCSTKRPLVCKSRATPTPEDGFCRGVCVGARAP